MIVYNVGRAWFTMKKDAESAQRRTPRSKLRPQGAPLNELRIETRDELAALLNAICGAPAGQETTFKPAGNSTPVVLPAYMNDPSWRDPSVPDWMPQFLRKRA